MPTTPVNSKWVITPASPSADYLGLRTNVDPTRVPDTAHVNGQNTYVNDGDRISTRPYGLVLFPSGTASVASGGIEALWTFHLRNGSNIMVRPVGTTLEMFDQGAEAWAVFLTGLTSTDFGFAEFNINANAESRLYFGNGVDDSGFWNGGYTNLNGALVGGEAVITVDSTASFGATGSLIIGTTTVTYTGVTATTFTGCVGTPAAADNLTVTQKATTSAGIPKGNIWMSAQNRLFVVPSANKQIVQFSQYGDASSWSTTTVLSSTATSAGAFNLIEGGGEVRAMCQDEKSIYFLKDACIYVATLTDALYSLAMLKPFDGRSRASGAVGRRGVFVGGNYVFVVTPDNQIKALERIETIDYPQLNPISEPIQPTCDVLDFSSVSGIAFREYAYFACKSSSSATTNDTVLVFNLHKGHWESPIVGWQVSEWTIYDDGTEPALYFGDAISPNIWKLDKQNITDGEYIVTSSYSTKRLDFGTPEKQKEFDDVFIEGYIAPTTSLTIRLLYDDNGYSGVQQTTFVGTETDYIMQGSSVNAFGLTPFGTARFGAGDDLSGKRKFRVFLNKNFRRVPFYNAQLEFSSSGQNQQWEVIRYGFLVREHSQQPNPKLQRDFT
jgi:hypothetical protein